MRGRMPAAYPHTASSKTPRSSEEIKPMMIGTEPSWSLSEKSSTSGTTTSVAIEVGMETNAESNGLRIGDACDIELEGQSHPMMQTPVAPYALEQ